MTTRPGNERIGSAPVTGEALNEIVNAVVHHHKEFFGRGPNHTRAFISGNTLVCVLEGVLTPAEETLVVHGEEDAVTEQREAAQRAMQDDLRALIESQLQRGVRSFMSTNDAEQGLMVELFVLDEPPPGAEAGVVSRDAERVVEDARAAVDELRALRAEHVQSREALRRTRQRRHEGSEE